MTKFKVGDILKRTTPTYMSIYQVLDITERNLEYYYLIRNLTSKNNFEFTQDIVENGFRKLTKLELALQ